MRKTALVLVLAALCLTACQAAIQTPIPDHKTPLPEPYDPLQLTAQPGDSLPENSENPAALFPGGVYAAQADLATQLGIDATEVQILRLNGQEWPDGCLGLGGAAEQCSAEVVPGYLVTLLANGRLYEYRTDEAGGRLRTAVSIDASAQAAVQQARWTLVDQLGGEAQDYAVVDVQALEWPDACLGIPAQAGQVCAAALTPGYRVLLQAIDLLYELHTNADGSQTLVAATLTAPIGQIYLRLTTSSDLSVCREILVGSGGVVAGSCGGVLNSAVFSGPDLAGQLSALAARFAPFEAETPAGALTFTGLGSEDAAAVQQRAIGAWTLLAAQATAGEMGPEPAQLMAWQRSGGIAGLCEEISVDAAGWASLYTCQGELNGQFFLDLDRLELLYNWVDHYAAQALTRNEDVADGFQYALTMNGSGAETPSDSAQDEWFAFAEALRTAFP